MDSEQNKSDIISDSVKKKTGKGQIVDVEEEKIKLVVFVLSGDFYAFYGSDIKEILPHTKIFFVPGTPDYIAGIINVRGDIESVLSINQFLGLPFGDETKGGRIAIAEKNGIRSGVLVDSIEDVIDFPVSSIKPTLPTLDRAKKELVSGETIYKGKNVTIIDIGNVFGRIRF